MAPIHATAAMQVVFKETGTRFHSCDIASAGANSRVLRYVTHSICKNCQYKEWCLLGCYAVWLL
jgi:radical SAM protein with 4Fe4S-binding SPASM domain